MACLPNRPIRPIKFNAQGYVTAFVSRDPRFLYGKHFCVLWLSCTINVLTRQREAPIFCNQPL
ncbi:hypothetical protein AGR7B_Cc10386 [Agrobacterium deltaense RV3]|nr:hypothetical protein AGR7B_Cc10386 [Agrobacterium deltaense RV3]